LASHPTKKVRVEGNADERGSSEYNLALGQRRANNTKKALVLAGAKADQIESISFGEEKPLSAGHDEASWAQNRRADINYK
jgi:peptidoglycan-associated lipoprotein